MAEIYLSDDIIIKHGLLYHEDKLVKRHNWHKHLDTLGWEKLHKRWITQLNQLHNPYPNNSLFGCLECGDDGDCLFHCIATSLNSVSDRFYDNTDIRSSIADSVTQEQFDHIITCYRCMKDIDDFNEQWDPYEITNLSLFQEQIKTSGHSYWGDYLLIQLLVSTFKVNVLILTQNELNDTYKLYPLALEYCPDYKTIILLHENESHFKLVGHFQSFMVTCFTHSQLPLEIIYLYNLSDLRNK